MDSRVTAFLDDSREPFGGQLLGTFVVCGTEGTTERGRQHIQSYFDKLHARLSATPPLSRNFGGRLVLERLSPEDRRAIEEVYLNFLHTQAHDWDRTDPVPARRFGAEEAALPGRQLRVVS